MTLIKLIPEDHIEELEQLEHGKFNKMLDSHAEAKAKSWEIKERWLAVFARCLSPTVACKQANVPLATYKKWRKTDPKFCRALNEVIEHAHDELVGTAYARATGYLQSDPETESGYQEDATGRPIRHGVSDRLAIALVGANQKAQEQTAPLTINVNFAALGISEDGKKLEQLPPNVVEGEVTKQLPEQAPEPDPDE